MSAAFSAFMHELIDYAGLFPPASLDLGSALGNYAHYRGEPEAWMLGRFIIPADRLPELAPYDPTLVRPGARPMRYALLAAGGATAAESLDRLHSQTDVAAGFLAEHAGTARIEVIETRLPDNLAAAADRDATAAYLMDFCRLLAETSLAGVDLFVEAAPPGGTADTTGDDAAIAALTAVADGDVVGATQGVRRLGYKLRSGGVVPDAFPPCERVAHVLVACRDQDRPLKFTAGLHHPVRHRADDPDVMMHGFLNVFGAGLLAHGLGLTADETVAIVADTEATSFRFERADFSWRDRSLPAAEVQRLRSRYLIGFGSCSFDEPREDLTRLRLHG